MGKPCAVFMGTPEFAVPALRALIGIADVPLVITQPDRPSGRGMKLRPPPVKVCAQEHGLEVRQPKKVKDGSLAALIRDVAPDLALVVAYGRILPLAVLDAPRLGCLNVHGSLLPRWRGAGPIQWSVLSGDRETGVCLMQMDEGMDTGPVLERASLEIGPDETSGALGERLSVLSAALLSRALPRFLAGELTAVAQTNEGATHARMLEKSDGVLQFARSARQVHDQVRGLSPWPGAHTTFRGGRLKVHRSRVAESAAPRTPDSAGPGTVQGLRDGGIAVRCADGDVLLMEVQPEGRRRMDAAAFMAGNALNFGDVLGA